MDFKTSDVLCIMQCVPWIAGFFCFTTETKPEFAPIMTGVPLVHTPTNLPQHNPVLSQKSIRTWKTSAAFYVVSNGWKKRNSSLIVQYPTYLLWEIGDIGTFVQLERKNTREIRFGYHLALNIVRHLVNSGFYCVIGQWALYGRKISVFQPNPKTYEKSGQCHYKQ